MRSPLDAMIFSDGNREGFKRVIEVTHAEEPQRIFLVGPAGSGKTTLLRARQLEKDLLSTKHVTYRECSDIIDAIRAGAFDEDMDALATTNVLLLDDFEGFIGDAELGAYPAQLLLEERGRRGFDTVITSRKPKSEFADLGDIAKVLDTFEEIHIEALEGDDLVALVESFIESYEDIETAPKLSLEAVNYIVNDLDVPIHAKANAVDFLMTKYEGEPGAELSADDVKRALEH